MVPCPPQKCTRGGEIDRPPVFALHFHLHPGPEGGEHDHKYHIIGVHPLVGPMRFRRCRGVVCVGINRQISRFVCNDAIWHFYLFVYLFYIYSHCILEHLYFKFKSSQCTLLASKSHDKGSFDKYW